MKNKTQEAKIISLLQEIIDLLRTQRQVQYIPPYPPVMPNPSPYNCPTCGMVLQPNSTHACMNRLGGLTGAN